MIRALLHDATGRMGGRPETSLRQLAINVIQEAVNDLRGTPQRKDGGTKAAQARRADALRFFRGSALDDWCYLCDLHPDAVRKALGITETTSSAALQESKGANE